MKKLVTIVPLSAWFQSRLKLAVGAESSPHKFTGMQLPGRGKR
jgi:hypothetical protein